MTIKIIAEIGINYNGDINIAKQLINSAKEAGANIVKFQKRDLESVYSKEFLDSPRSWNSMQNMVLKKLIKKLVDITVRVFVKIFTQIKIGRYFLYKLNNKIINEKK